ncbi:putative nucleic acid-binding protein [Helianthus annuus]|nr:putative nucleic acid-binding protein [Helianthus annuus]
MFLSELREGNTGPIMIMFCRKRDVTSVNGRYMSTDYIVTDIKGGVTHCTARNNIVHYFFDKLKEGSVYLVNGFAVQPTNQYRVLKDIPFVIGLHGSTIVKRVDDDGGHFERYPHGHFESFNCKNVLLDGDGCKPFGSSTPPSIPAKDKGVLPIPTPVKRVEAIVRPAYANSDSEETVDGDPHESQLVGDGIGDDGGMR